MPDISAETELAAKLFEPRALARAMHAADKLWRAMAKSGHFAEFITSGHSNSKLAAIGKAFEEITTKPLTKRFLRKRPTLILMKDAHLPAEQRIPGVALISDKTMIVSETALDKLTPAELKNGIAHDTGHLLAGDLNFRRGQALQNGTTETAELLADQVGVFLTEDPEGTKNGLRKAYEAIADNAKQSGGVAFKKVTDQKIGAEGRYPSLDERFSAIDEVAAHLKTEEGKSFIRDELIRRLNDRHQEVFGRKR